jgi:hypothetical protein
MVLEAKGCHRKAIGVWLHSWWTQGLCIGSIVFFVPYSFSPRGAYGSSTSIWPGQSNGMGAGKIFERKTFLDTSDIRREMGVTRKKGGSTVDKAIQELQQLYYVTVVGSRRKTDKFGQPYGWPANVYDKVENWVPEEWMTQNAGLSSEEAKERIRDHGIAITKNLSRSELAKILGM